MDALTIQVYPQKYKQSQTMKTTSFKNITRAVLFLIMFFFVSMAVFAQRNSLGKVQHKEVIRYTTEPYHHVLK